MAEYITATSTRESKEKIKTPFAKIIVNDNPEKTYYNIMWWQDGEMHIGFGSANLSFVRKWLNEEFDVEYPATDVAPVVRGRWGQDYYFDEPVTRCSACKVGFATGHKAERFTYCPNCGAKMDGGGADG